MIAQDPATGTKQPESTIWTANRVRARWFDALSLLLPAGERFVIDAAREAESAWSLDAELACAVRQLIREEQAHQRTHDRYNQGLQASGLPVAQMQARLDRLMAPMAKWSLDERILMAAALEQWTALLSREVLRSRSWLGRQESATVRMWRWHCTEEIEHHGTVTALAKRARRAPLQWTMLFIMAALWVINDVRRFQFDMLALDLARQEATRWSVMRDAACFAAQNLYSTLRILVNATPHLLRPGRTSSR